MARGSGATDGSAWHGFAIGMALFHGAASKTSTQSFVPVPLSPGVVNSRKPLLANGDPSIARYVPSVGLYQRACAAPLSLAMFTVIVRAPLPVDGM